MIGGLLRTYLLASKATHEEQRTVDVKMQAIREARMRMAKTGAQHARELEDDLGRVALLARALAEVCLKKGLLTHEELGRMIVEVDMADGTGDGKLDPRVAMPGERKLASLEPTTPPQARVQRRPRTR